MLHSWNKRTRSISVSLVWYSDTHLPNKDKVCSENWLSHCTACVDGHMGFATFLFHKTKQCYLSFYHLWMRKINFFSGFKTLALLPHFVYLSEWSLSTNKRRVWCSSGYIVSIISFCSSAQSQHEDPAPPGGCFLGQHSTSCHSSGEQISGLCEWLQIDQRTWANCLGFGSGGYWQ